MALKILTAADVDAVLGALDMQLAVRSQAEMFAAYSSEKTEDAPGIPALQLPQRHVLTSPSVSMLFMPGRAAAQTAIKIVSVPTAGGDGLPATTLIMDEKSGAVRAVVNARKLTAVRNAAGSVLSMQVLGPATPASLVVFGSGAQAEAHIRAFTAAYPSISSVTVVARKETARSLGLVSTIKGAFPAVTVTHGVASFSDGTSDNFDLSAAVANADIICTMTSSTKPLFASKDVKKGAHICMIGSYKPHMREVEDALIQRAGVILVDSREACAHEAGELQNVPADKLVEIGELVTKKVDAKRVADAEVHIFKSVGLGVQDVAIAGVVLTEAERLGLGTVVPEYD